MLSRSRYSGDARGKFVGEGGSYFWKGVRKKGGSDEPPEPPPGYGPGHYCHC